MNKLKRWWLSVVGPTPNPKPGEVWFQRMYKFKVTIVTSNEAFVVYKMGHGARRDLSTKIFKECYGKLYDKLYE